VTECDPVARMIPSADLTASSSSGRVLDAPSLDQLRELQEPGGPDVLGETIAIFLADSEPRVAQLRRVVGEGNALEARRVAHALRGGALVLGAVRLARACGALETAGAEEWVGSGPALLERVLVEYDLARDAMRDIVRPGGAA
jgi:HPt (histidine-containing phosphotransfer) domain-containing protein